MQLVEGRTLSGEVRERGPLRERETARIAIPLLEALEYSHARGIVHRDIKPENIILDREGRPFLMDFGIAKSAGSLVKTQTGFLLGTPAYVAPEQAQGKKLDGRADLYALGVTLYKTASGAYPFEANDPLQAVILRLTQPPRPLGEARPGVDPAFASDRHAGPRARAGRVDGLPRARCGTRSTPTSRAGRRRRRRRAFSDPGDPGTAWRRPRLSRPSRPSSAPSRLLSPYARPRHPRAPSPLPPWARRRAARTSSRWPRCSSSSCSPSAERGSSSSGPAGNPQRSRTSLRPAVLPTRSQPTPEPLALPPVPTPVTTPTAPESAPTAAPEPTAATLRVLRPTRPPDPAPPPVRRPVTLPERLTPDPPFAGAPPGGCSGAAVTVGFAIDPDGHVVSPRLFPSDAAPECGRFVLDALPRWQWRPAVDAAGAPVLSARLVVYVQLP